MAMEYNMSPISLREGSVFLGGLRVMDAIKCTISITPEVWSGLLLGERTKSRRWLSIDITGNLTQRRTTPFYKDQVMEFLRSGATPEFTIQGIMEDISSDFYAIYGSETVTCVGCVFTGEISLLSLDSGGQVLEDSIGFGAKGIV